MQSDLRRPERWRGRVRSPFAEWSVFIGAAVAIGVGILFWASVWLVLRSPSRTVTVVSADVAEAAVPATDVITDVVDDLDESDTIAALEPAEDLDVPSHRTAVIPGVTDVVAIADASDDREATEWDEVEGPAVETEAVAQAPVLGPAEPGEDPLYGPFEVATSVDPEGRPLYGPFEVAGPTDAQAVAQAIAQVDGPADPVVARAGEVGVRVDEISARAEEMTARAEAFATKAEEFATRIEGLTARIDELETKLQASGSSLTVRPAAVASPAPVVASRQPSQTTQTTVVRNSMALGANGRAPWVVAPQPEPNSRVAAGVVVLESRARGEAPITSIRMQLDGAPVQVALDRRDEWTWRGRSSVRVSPGTHSVAVTVVDGEGRTGSYRWQFVAQ